MTVGDDVQEIRRLEDSDVVFPDADPTLLPEPEAEDDLPDQIEAAVVASLRRAKLLPWTAATARNGGRGTTDLELLDPASILESVQDAGGFFALVREPLVWPSFERKARGWAGDDVRREFSIQSPCLKKVPDDPWDRKVVPVEIGDDLYAG